MNKELTDFFGTDNTSEGDWFAWVDSSEDRSTGEIVFEKPKDGAMEFCIRLMTGYFEEVNKGKKKEHKMVVNPATRAMERVSYYPDLSPEEEAQQTKDAYCYAIIAARKGNDLIELSRDEKIYLTSKPKFLRFMKRVFDILNGEAERSKEKAEKN